MRNFRKFIIKFFITLYNLLFSSKMFKMNDLSPYVKTNITKKVWPEIANFINKISNLRSNLFSDISFHIRAKIVHFKHFWVTLRIFYIIRVFLLLVIFYKPAFFDFDILHWLFNLVVEFVLTTIGFVWAYSPLSEWWVGTLVGNISVFVVMSPFLITAYYGKKIIKKVFNYEMSNKEVISWADWFAIHIISPVVFFFYDLFFIFYLAIMPTTFLLLSNFDDFNFILSFFNYLFEFFNFKFISSILDIFLLALCSLIYILQYFKSVFFIFYYGFYSSYLEILIYLLKINLNLFLDLGLYDGFIKFLFFLIYFIFSNLFLIANYLGLVSFFEFFNFSISYTGMYSFFNFNFSTRDIFSIYSNFFFSDNLVILILMGLKFFIFKGFEIAFSFYTVFFFFNDFLMNLFFRFNYLTDLVFSFLIFKIKILNKFYSSLLFFYNSYYVYTVDLNSPGLFNLLIELDNYYKKTKTLSNTYTYSFIIYFYLTIIVFWFLDLGFRVSASAIPRTPIAIFERAKLKYNWIPQNSNYVTFQTIYPDRYFALLDISYEFAESIEFTYAYNEHLDEEFDEMDDDMDWENPEDEKSIKMREILTEAKAQHDSNLLNNKQINESDLLESFIGEPDLQLIDSYLKWAYDAIYYPSMEELLVVDPSGEEWMFDPDTDVSVFEFLLFLPLAVYLSYVYFSKYFSHSKLFLYWFYPFRKYFVSSEYLKHAFIFPEIKWLEDFFNNVQGSFSPERRLATRLKFQQRRQMKFQKIRQLFTYLLDKRRYIYYRAAFDEIETWLHTYGAFIRFERAHGNNRVSKMVIFWDLFNESWWWIRSGDVRFWVPYNMTTISHRWPISVEQLIWWEWAFDVYSRKKSFRKWFNRELRFVRKMIDPSEMPLHPKFWAPPMENPYFWAPVKRKFSYNYYHYLSSKSSPWSLKAWSNYPYTPVKLNRNLTWAFRLDTVGVLWKARRRKTVKRVIGW